MSQKQDLEKQITEHHRRLQVLKEREARQGVETPPSVILEIEDIEAKIAALQAELQTLADNAETVASPSPVTSPPSNSQKSNSRSPLSMSNIIAGIIVTVVGGLLLLGIVNYTPTVIALLSSSPTPTLISEPTDLPDPSAGDTDTPTPIPSPTDTPTPIPSPTDTPTPIPSPTDTPTPLCAATPEHYSDVWKRYPDLGCPEDVLETGFTYQEFENGVFAWVQETDEILVFFESDMSWDSYPDPFIDQFHQHCAPDSNPSLMFGFGKLYCENQAIADRVGVPQKNANAIEDFFVPKYNDMGNVIQNFENGKIVKVTPDRLFILHSDGEKEGLWEEF